MPTRRNFCQLNHALAALLAAATVRHDLFKSLCWRMDGVPIPVERRGTGRPPPSGRCCAWIGGRARGDEGITTRPPDPRWKTRELVHRWPTPFRAIFISI